MYRLPYFSEDDRERLLGFVAAHPFATLVAVGPDNSPTATHIPVFAERRGDAIFLKGHMLKASDHCKAFRQNPNALCIFNSSYAYVSATWYTDPHTASTVNYMSVHAKGSLRFLDEAGLAEVLQLTSKHFEPDPAAPPVFANIDPAERAAMMKLLEAFEIEVNDILGTFKLSQNRDETSYDNILVQLEKGDAGQREIAAHMRENRPRLFKGKS